MSYRLKNCSLLLAALLQILPLVRTVFTHPAVTSTWAIVFRWAIGGTAAIGAFDSVSGATSVFTTPSAFSGAVGTPFSANVTVSIGGGNTANSSDYLYVSSGGVNSPLLLNNQSTTLTMPPGLTFTASWLNGASTIGGIISGTPTTAGTYPTTVTVVSPGNASLSQAITITITGQSTPTAPSITSSPAATNIIAGRTAVFTVAASGTAPLTYAWLKNNSPLTDGGNISGSGTATLTVANVSDADAGNYSATVANATGSATSSAAALTVINPPVVTTQPQPQNGATGGSATFTAAASGTAPLTWLWRKNGVAVTNGVKFSGASTATLGISALAATDAGNYSVFIANTAGSVTSSPAALVVSSSPLIATPPASQTVAAGANVSFTVAAAGSAPLFYFWSKNGNPLANTTATLSLVAVTTNDAGNYSVIVSNTLGTASASATLAVVQPPVITASPSSATVTVGGSASFSAAASGSAPITWQWRKNGANISGATSSTLALANISTNDAGNYLAVAANSVGSVTSAVATLTVLVPPRLLAQPASVTAAVGSNAVLSVSATGTSPLSFQWSKDGSPLADGGTISGSSSNVLRIVPVAATDAGNYSVSIVNAAGSTNSTAATLTVVTPPSIVMPPAPVAIIAGNPASFTVSADGTAPFTYQWRKNGANIPGATSATLSFPAITATNAGNYSAVIANLAGSVTSADAALTVLLPPSIVTQPVSSFTAPGGTATLTVAVGGTAPFTYQWFKAGSPLADGGNISGANTATLSVAAVSTNDYADYFVAVANSYGSATSAVVRVTINSAPIFLTQPASLTVARSNAAAFTATVTGTGPLAYQWSRNGVKIAGATNTTLAFLHALTNNNGNYSVVVTNRYGRATSAVATLTVIVPPTFALQASNRWAKAGSISIFRASVTGTAPFQFQWFKDGSPLTDGGNIFGATSNVLTVTQVSTNDTGNYFLTASNFAGGVASSNAQFTVVLPPVIVAQPADLTVVQSNAATFSVSVSGTAAIRFQWRKAGKAIIGATNASYVIPLAKTNDIGLYSVLVTNRAGSLISSNAQLIVLQPPVFITQAASQTVNAGSAAVFKATVRGTAPFRYQWLRNGARLENGINITGANSNVLTIAKTSRGDVGAYVLTVTNDAAGITSSNAVLTVKFRNDGDDDKNANVVVRTALAVVSAPAAPQFNAITIIGGNALLSAQAAPGTDYILQTSGDLAQWTDMTTNAADGSGNWQATVKAEIGSLKFYRLRTTAP